MLKQSFSENNPLKNLRQHKWLLPFVAFEFVSQIVAWGDIWNHRRSMPTSQRIGWSALTLIQPIGPWIYYLLGRSKFK